jgi:hypothetical protein
MLTKVVSQQQHAARPNKAGTPVTSGMKAAVGTRGTSWMSTAAGPPESVGKSVTVENLATGMPEQQGPQQQYCSTSMDANRRGRYACIRVQ